MSKKFYIKSGKGAILGYVDTDVSEWELNGMPVDMVDIEPTDPRAVMFDTHEEAQEVSNNHGNFEVVEFKEVEEVEKIKLYGIQFVTDVGLIKLVSVVNSDIPLQTEGDVAVVSAKPEKLVHLVEMLPEHSQAKIVEVTMNAHGRFVISKR